MGLIILFNIILFAALCHFSLKLSNPLNEGKYTTIFKPLELQKIYKSEQHMQAPPFKLFICKLISIAKNKEKKNII
jgi:hypothetical protein